MGRSGMKQERERRHLQIPSDYPLRARAMSKGSYTSLLKRLWGRSFNSKLLNLPKTDVWERLLSVLGTRGGRSKVLTLILAAQDTKHGVLELLKV